MNKNLRTLLLVACSLTFLVFSVPAHMGMAGITGKRNNLRILTSFLPIHILTGNVVQGISETSVELLLPPGSGCPHHYRLTTGDLKKLASGNVLVINGLGMEEFVSRPLLAANPHIRIIDSSRGITPIYLKEHQKDAHSGYTNPHIWMSPMLAICQVENISLSLSAIDPAHAKSYQSNAARFSERLRQLDKTIKSTSNRVGKRKVIAFHGVFDYLARDLGITVAAYIADTPGQFPSARELNRLILVMRKEKVQAIFAESNDQIRLAETLKRETGVPFYVLDPMTTAQGPVGLDYYEKSMQKNLLTLQAALGGN